MQKTSKQHVVPEYYLSRFTSDGQSIHAYDKLERRQFQTNNREIAQQNGFYDVLTESAGHDGNQTVEHILAELENRYSQALEGLVTAIGSGKDWREFKEVLAFFIVLQATRAHEYRSAVDQLFASGEGIGAEAERDQDAGSLSDPSHLTQTSAELAALWHRQLVVSPGHINNMSQPLLDHIWIVGANDTGQPLYSSDNPVIAAAHNEVPPIDSGRLAAEGIEIQWPISPKYILLLYNGQRRAESKADDGRVVQMNSDDVLYFNCVQVAGCWRCVYVNDGDFSIADEVCSAHPEICSPDRYRPNRG